MTGRDANQFNAVIDQFAGKRFIKGSDQSELPYARFDCDLPEARDTEKLLVGFVFNQ
jgi:hypothetical protein